MAMFVAVCLAAPASPDGESHAGDRPANFVQWRAGLASSGQPDAAALAQVKAQGYTLVINLAPPRSHGSISSEAAIVGRQGVRYLNIAVDFDNPTSDDFKAMSEAIKTHAGGDVLVHCQVNMRAASFVFLYRVIHENASAQEEATKLTGVWIPNRTWKRFIDDTLAAGGKKAEIL